MQRQVQDRFFNRAKALGYVARSAFKLEEIQKKHRVILPGSYVLDLGCTPGSWLQVACQALGKRGGRVVGIDLQATPLPAQHCDGRVHILRGDVIAVSPNVLRAPLPIDGGAQFGTILSDMAPSTSGSAHRDAALSLGLAGSAARLALKTDPPLLKAGGCLVVKVLEGEGLHDFVEDMKQCFVRVIRQRPVATRRESRELYVVCMGKKADGDFMATTRNLQ